jgi:hypothetical protein
LNVRSHSSLLLVIMLPAAADTGIVEQQVDLVGLVAVGNLVPKPLYLLPVGDIRTWSPREPAHTRAESRGSRRSNADADERRTRCWRGVDSNF